MQMVRFLIYSVDKADHMISIIGDDTPPMRKLMLTFVYYVNRNQQYIVTDQ